MKEEIKLTSEQKDIIMRQINNNQKKLIEFVISAFIMYAIVCLIFCNELLVDPGYLPAQIWTNIGLLLIEGVLILSNPFGIYKYRAIPGDNFYKCFIVDIEEPQITYKITQRWKFIPLKKRKPILSYEKDGRREVANFLVGDSAVRLMQGDKLAIIKAGAFYCEIALSLIDEELAEEYILR